MPGFQHCQWCYGRGCIACDAEERKWNAARDAEYKRQFPDGPKPIFTARLDNPEEMATLAAVFGRASLEHAFGPSGGGMEEIMEKLRQRAATPPPALPISTLEPEDK